MESYTKDQMKLVFLFGTINATKFAWFKINKKKKKNLLCLSLSLYNFYFK